MPLNLVTDSWLPIRRTSGKSDRVRIADLCARHSEGPPARFDWGRADLDVASLELVIGILTVAFAPGKYGARLDKADPAALQCRLDPLAPAFMLDGPPPRFLQDQAELGGEVLPIDALLIDGTGEYFAKPGRFGATPVLSRAAAAIALYALQAFAPSGGRGHRTSLRGGGPMTTLVVPDDDESARPLWDLLIANVPGLSEVERPPAAPGASARLFPWLAPTLTSEEKGAPQVHDSDPRVHPLQVFFGMPRRVVLMFAPNPDGTPCAITGEVDEVVATGFRARHGGTNYGAWVHPLTPYRADKTGKLPMHPREGRQSYADWIGLAFGRADNGTEPARVVHKANARLFGNRTEHRLLVAGYAMDNAKVLDFKIETVPLVLARTAEGREGVERGARQMVAAAEAAGRALRRAVGNALYRRIEDVPRDASVLTPLRDRLFARTEAAFTERLKRARDIGTTALAGAEDPARSELDDWLAVLKGQALRIYDEAVPLGEFDALDEKDVERIVAARRGLDSGFAGYGALGKDLFGAFGVVPPDAKAKKAVRKPKENA